MRSLGKLCLLAVAAAMLFALPVRADSLEAGKSCPVSAVVSAPIQLARMDPSKCFILCKIKRQNCGEDCAATAGDSLKSCKQGCRAAYEACTLRCS